MSFIAWYVYTYDEFVIVDRTGHRQQKNNIQIGNVQKHNIQYRQLCVYRSDMCKFEMKISMCDE